MNQKILVTGGSGLIGSYLQQIIPGAEFVSSKDFNLLRIDHVENMFRKIKPNIVIHLAALVGGIHHNIEEPVKYFEENILMNTHVIKESYKNNVKRFIGHYLWRYSPEKGASGRYNKHKAMKYVVHESIK